MKLTIFLTTMIAATALKHKCTSDAQCPAGTNLVTYKCEFSDSSSRFICVPKLKPPPRDECSKDRDCPWGSPCVWSQGRKLCQPPAPTPTLRQCSTDWDCPPGGECVWSAFQGRKMCRPSMLGRRLAEDSDEIAEENSLIAPEAVLEDERRRLPPRLDQCTKDWQCGPEGKCKWSTAGNIYVCVTMKAPPTPPKHQCSTNWDCPRGSPCVWSQGRKLCRPPAVFGRRLAEESDETTEENSPIAPEAVSDDDDRRRQVIQVGRGRDFHQCMTNAQCPRGSECVWSQGRKLCQPPLPQRHRCSGDWDCPPGRKCVFSQGKKSFSKCL